MMNKEQLTSVWEEIQKLEKELALKKRLACKELLIATKRKLPKDPTGKRNIEQMEFRPTYYLPGVALAIIEKYVN